MIIEIRTYRRRKDYSILKKQIRETANRILEENEKKAELKNIKRN